MSQTPDTAAATAATLGILFDKSKPEDQRAKMFAQIVASLASQPNLLEPLFRELLAQVKDIDEVAKFKVVRELYEQVLEELKNGAPRPGTFIAKADESMPGPKPRVHVVCPDGVERYPIVLEGTDAESLQSGMTVFMDANGAAVLGASEMGLRVGQEAPLIRALPDIGCVEITHQESKLVLYAAGKLLDRIAAGEVKRGDSILWSQRQQFAFDAMPADDDRKFRFIDNSRIPDVNIARDVGRPHWILGRLIRRTRQLLHRTDLLQRFDMRPRYMVFLSGPSGTGKTLTIKAYLSWFHQELKATTGRDDLGTRVIRVKASDILSEWFGVSDRRIDELFDDIYALGSEEHDVNGEQRRLPVVVIFEEAEGLTRRRGEFDGAVYDRVIGTLLQRLDDPSAELSKLPIIWLTTSNAARLVDAAAWRRLSNVRANFSRLDREGFTAVLGKKLREDYPFTAENGAPPAELRRAAIDRVVGWMYSPNGEDRGQLELTFRDGKKLTKHRRDFLTGAIVEQAVADAIDDAVAECEQTGDERVGLDAGRIIAALTRAVDSLADNVTQHNAADYLDLPEHTGVATVRRIHETSGHLGRLAN